MWIVCTKDELISKSSYLGSKRLQPYIDLNNENINMDSMEHEFGNSTPLYKLGLLNKNSLTFTNQIIYIQPAKRIQVNKSNPLAKQVKFIT
jgi:hypothetical protein